jgi:hypothetical protein
MGIEVTATFEVTSWDEHEFDRRRDSGKVTKAKVRKAYHGDIDGESLTEWLLAYDDAGSATFVGLERIVGSIGDRRGTIVLRHVGSFEDGVARAELAVVAGSGSGELAELSGTGDFVADPAGRVHLELELP